MLRNILAGGRPKINSRNEGDLNGALKNKYGAGSTYFIILSTQKMQIVC